jgi:Zn-dependent protease
MNEIFVTIFYLAVILFSVIIHEVSHGVMALRLGDPTAKNAGRLTMNPISHFDPIGSFLVPFFFSLIPNAPTIGWAKPVPYNPANLRDPKRGAGLIAAIGPFSNLLLAILFGTFSRLLPIESLTRLKIIAYAPFGKPGFQEVMSLNPSFWGWILYAFSIVVFLNIVLAIFNLLPLPPLDGSNVLFALLPYRYRALEQFLTRYGFFLLIAFIFFGSSIIQPIIFGLYELIV